MTKKKDIKDLLPRGRPTTYKPEFCDEIIEHFDIEPYRVITRVHQKTGNEYSEKVANDLPTLAGFAASLGVSRQTLTDWAKRWPEFSYAITRAKVMGEKILVTNTLLGLYNSHFAQFVAKNYTSMRDVQEVRVEDNREKPATPEEQQAEIEALDEKIRILEEEL